VKIKKESYIYDYYYKWAKSNDAWNNFITKEKDNYHIGLVGAIGKQLKNIDITHIEIYPINTTTDPNYYSHVEEVKGTQKNGEQNW